MKSYKTPSQNCPTCCPQKCGSSSPFQLSNGQVPINLSKAQKPAEIQGPRRFIGRDWKYRQFRGFRVPEGIFDRNLIRRSWNEVQSDSIKSGMAMKFGSVSEIAESGTVMLKNQWTTSCSEVGAAVKYLRHLWLMTSDDGNYSQKIRVVNRMIFFYLILLGIYIAESTFWVNQQLIEGLCGVALKPKRNVDMLMGLGGVAIFIFSLYLIGGPTESPGVCDSPD